jgi:hypothetical protein
LAVNPTLYNDDIEQLIRLSADDVNYSTLPGEDEKLGTGRINASRALQLLQLPNRLYHETVVGGDTVAMNPRPWYPMWFYVPPDSSPGSRFWVRRYEVRRAVTFARAFGPAPFVWARGAENATVGYSDESPNWNMGWCEAVPTSITASGCSLRTFVYEVRSYTTPPVPIGWWPTRYDSVRFGFTILGELAPTDTGDNPEDPAAVLPAMAVANPIRHGETISLWIPQAGSVRVRLFDVAGRRVASLQDGRLARGRHDLRWTGFSDRGRILASGLYFLRLDASGAILTRKLIVVD